MSKYIVLESQLDAEGTLGTLVSAYDDRSEAESQYHSILASASVSSVAYHTAFMLTPDGYVVKSECYKHEEEEE